MCDSEESLKLEQSSLTWALWGILIGVTTFGGLGWAQLHDPLIADALVALLAIGCTPAALASGIALWRGWKAAEIADSNSSSSGKPWGFSLGLIGLMLLFLGASFFFWDLQRRDDLRAKWVVEARAEVSRWLAESDGLPAEYRDKLGRFHEITLDSFREGVFKGAGKMLARCTARYEHGEIPIRMIVGTNRGTLDESPRMEISNVGHETVDGRQGLGVNVSHPDLRKL